MADLLREEPVEYIREQFREKDGVLSTYAERVSAVTLYEDIFGDLETVVPVTMLGDAGGKKVQRMQIADALEWAAGRNDVLMGGATYWNDWVSKRSTRNIHAFIIDLDNAYSGVFKRILQDDWKNANGKVYPKPTYIANSGAGLHLYFVFEEPIPGYKRLIPTVDKLYRTLAKDEAVRPYTEEQIQWYGQQFRTVGGGSKYGDTITAYRYGPKWNPDELAKFYGIDFHFPRRGETLPALPKMELAEPTKRPRKTTGRGGFVTHRGFFDSSLENCKAKTQKGHRYYSMCALAAIAWKSGIERAELEEALLSLLPIYNKRGDDTIKDWEVRGALKMFGPDAIRANRPRLESWMGWAYQPSIQRRRGKDYIGQEKHLILARAMKQTRKTIGIMKPEGKPSARQTVADYMAAHPGATKTEVKKATGLTYPTIRKYYADVRPAE